MRRSAALALLLASSPALANGVSVQNFTPASGSNFMFSETGGPPELPPGSNRDSYRRYFLGFNYNYLNSPLVELNAAGTERTGVLVENVQTYDVLAGIEWNGRISLNANLPLNMVQLPGEAHKFTAGDIRLFPKLYLSDPVDAVQVALIPELRLNTGDPALFSSDDGVSYGMSVALERDFGAIAGAVNVGYRHSPYAQFEDLDYKHRLPMTLSLSIPMSQEFRFNLEGAVQVTVPFSQDQNPSEGYAGLNYQATREVALMGGAAVGSFNSTSSSDYRVLLGLRFSPVSSDPLPVQQSAGTAAPVIAPQPAPTAPIVVERVVVREAEPKTIIKLVPSPARVVFTDREIKVRDEVIFEHNSDRLAKPSKALLMEVATVIKQNKSRFRRVRIEGHTNEIGTDRYNLKLSQKRATAVRKFLITHGVPASKLAAKGYGKREPKVTARSGFSRETRLVLNRRVKFAVVQ